MNNVIYYFTELDFYYKEIVLGKSIFKKKKLWVIIVYMLLSIGIFSRQITKFPQIDLNLNNLRTSVFLASLIVGFAVLPLVIKRLNKITKGKPKIEHIMWSFSMGFFIDLIISNLLAK